MLRNQQKCKQLIYFMPLQHRLFHQQNNILYNKSANVFRQGKIMGKLFGNKVSGSKKRWFPATTDSNSPSPYVVFRQSQFNKTPNGGGKNVTRRMAVLNKLFMEHITDLMATGEISETILGKGLQVSRVKISQDFAYVNVFWLTSGEPGKDILLEHELQRCSGMLRHELSQLGLMGEVPRIKFVKDKIYTNMHQVEVLLKNMNFGKEEENEANLLNIDKYTAETVKQEFYGGKTPTIPTENDKTSEEITQESLDSLKAFDVNVPEMRHDVLGLDHKDIMLKISTKMRKSKQAWDQHEQNSAIAEGTNSATVPSTSFEQLTKVNEKLAKAAANSEKFEAFLAKRKERRNTPERKKFRVADHNIDVNSSVEHDYPELLMSERQRQMFEAEDYLSEDLYDKRHK